MLYLEQLVNISPTFDVATIKNIVTHPKLYNLAGHCGDPADYVPDLNNLWLLVKSNNEVAGLIGLSEFTKITAVGHIYILPEYQTTGLSEAAVYKAAEILKENTYIRQIIIPVPTECRHVHLFMQRIKAQKSGIIKNGIIYNNNLQDLILYQYEL